MATFSFTAAQARAWLHEPGFGLGSSQFTYSVPTLASVWTGYGLTDEPFSGYQLPTIALAGAFRTAVAAWDELIAPDFAEVADDASSAGELRIAFTDVGEFEAGHAYQGPPQPAGGRVGDVWIGNEYADEAFERGDYMFMAVVHEVGHTLGLKHSFDEPSPTPAAFDNHRFSVMAYAETPDLIVRFERAGGSLQGTLSHVFAATPMVLDVAAVQAVYGADLETRASDTVYRFGDGDGAFQTIYDAGGIDTFDLSATTLPNSIDLQAGAYSSVGEWSREAQTAYWVQQFPEYADFIRSTLNRSDLYTWTNNVGIALSTVIENATGGSAADTLVGNAAANRLDGGAGADSMSGGLGDDTYIVDNSGDIVVELASAGVDTVTATLTYTLGANVERLVLGGSTSINGTGNAGANALTGNAAANILDGAAGADTLAGGAGDDVYVIDNSGDRVVELAGDGVDLVRSILNFSLLGTEVENLTLLGSGNTTGTGNAFANTLLGNSGSNLLDGGAGADVLQGGAGNDLYVVDNVGDRVVELAGGGADLVRSWVSFSLAGTEAEYLTLLGAGNTSATGNALANTLTGNAGKNVLDGGAGADLLQGQGGDDLYLVDHVGDRVIEQVGGGNDLVRSSVSFSLAGTQVEYLTLLGTADLSATGNALANTLTGNTGSNVLDGGAGRDLLFGHTGADRFVFASGSSGSTAATADVIRDFSRAQGDLVDLRLVDANTALAGDQAFGFIGTAAYTGQAGELRLQTTGGILYLAGDTDGNGVADILIRFDGNPPIGAGDLLL